MRFKKPLIIPALYWDEGARKLQELDIEAPITENSYTRDVYLYEISSITDFEEEGKRFTQVYTGPTSFTMTTPMEEFIQTVEQHIENEA